MASARDIRAKLDRLPDQPGVYLYRDAGGQTIYVGKAKSLRSRVRSYFQPSAQHTPRIARLVAEVADLEVIVVGGEMEALILESNLIKENRPRYNIVLRDDKQFPYLKLSLGDPYPRVSLVRRARSGRDLYVGPFTPTWVARRTLKMIPRFFRVATCNEVFDGKRRPCLYYHLDQCLAPCAGKTTPEQYGRAVDDVRLFLEGRNEELGASLEASMREASESQEFEEAARLRDTLRTLERLAEKQRMASVGFEDQDYFAHHAEGEQVSLQLFQVRGGRVRGRREFNFEDVVVGLDAFYAQVLGQYYAEADIPAEVYVAAEPAEAPLIEAWLGGRRGGRVRLRVPRRGEKRRLLALVTRNARLSFEERFRRHHARGVEQIEALSEALGLDEPPFRIECFDISNIQGSDPVGSLVVWEGGKPKKSDYRSFNIRGVRGPDDFASMAEVVTRRYRRLLAEGRRLPDLVLIDGGAGQLGSAVGALAAVGLPMLPVVALAKREEELYVQGRGEPLRLDRSSPALRLVQRIRDEAHRFAVSRHRRRRKQRTLRTELTEIPGVGPVTARKLLRVFGSLRGVREADAEALRAAVGPRLAERVQRHFAEAS